MKPRLHRALVLACSAALVAPLPAQRPRSSGVDRSAVLTIVVSNAGAPLEDAAVSVDTVSGLTDVRGTFTLGVRPGVRRVVAMKIGFRPESLLVAVRSGADTSVSLTLETQRVELSAITVSATRSGRRIEEEPLRVEMLEQEEVEEKLLMTPGDITMMLNESAGLRVQATSPSLGGANVRVQGLRGRYTQILSDGLPLYGGQTGGLGLLQIPPMDLGGVEIIKGAASALYGGSALGGVINLLSRRPDEQPVRELLLNQTTLGGSDVVGFASGSPGMQWGYTILGGAHRQSQVDRDDDLWIDLPGYDRAVIRPRAFWQSTAGHSVMATIGTTLETREGGTMPGGTVPGGGAFAERLRTNRHDAGLVAGFLLGDESILTIRAAGSLQRHWHTFGGTRERDRHLTWLGESSVTAPQGRSLWVIGAAMQQERYRAQDVAGFDYRFTIPGVFVQNTFTASPRVAVTASARADRHSEYGTQFAPRVSALVRLSDGWSVRASGGGGYFAPSPFTEETEVTGLTPLQPSGGLRVERARSGSVDLGGAIRGIELNLTVFASRIAQPVAVRPVVGDTIRIELVNLTAPTRTRGAEVLVRWLPEPFHVTASYTHVRSTETDPETGLRRLTPLTPRHQAGVVAMWEQEERARIGVELYYTGSQPLGDNPYRDASEAYVHIGVLAERRFGRARLFINAENLLGNRQTRHDPLVLPARGAGGRWTTDAWGPLEGRVANVGVRLDG